MDLPIHNPSIRPIKAPKATIAEMADRVISLRDGMISEIQENKTKKQAHELKW